MLDFKKIGKKNICLIGLMGSGKSVIGKDLSRIYNLKFYDSDLEIEKIAKKSINDIFLDHGESHFRELEEKICNKLLNTNNCIIALGGGSITNLKVRKLIEKNSFSIYLKVDINTLLNRLKNNHKRPLLKKINKKQKLEELFKARKEFYNMANLIVENNCDKNKLLDQINTEILFNE